MNILYKVLISIFILSNISCDIFKPEPYTSITNFKIVNSSEEKIELIKYFRNNLPSNIIIQINEVVDIDKNGLKGQYVPDTLFEGYDSIRVIFNDLVSIMHKRITEEGKDVNRNLLFLDSYTGGVVNDHRFEYEYIFTDNDYQEALDNNN